MISKNGFKLSLMAAAMALALGACSKRADYTEMIGKAQTAVEKGDFAEASIHVKNLIQSSPKDPGARLSLAQIGLRMGDFVMAETEARKSLELGASPASVFPVLWEALAFQGEFHKLSTEIAAAKISDPALAALSLAYQGRAQLILKKPDLAKGSFMEALKLQPDLPMARAGLIVLQSDYEKDAAGAKASLEALLAKSPNTHEAQALLATMLGREGKLAEAKVAISKALGFKPYDLEQRAALCSVDIALGDFKAADEDIRIFRKMAPRSQVSAYLAGLSAWSQGDLAKAKDELQGFQQKGNNFLPGLELAADVALATGQLTAAEDLAKTLLARDPTSIRAQRVLARTYLAMNSPEKAMTVLAPLIQAKTNDPELLSMTGEALMRTGDQAKGVQFLDAAVAASGNSPSFKLAAAQARAASGDESSAVQMLDGVAASLGPAGQTDLAVARSLAGAKRYDKAIELVNRYIQARPKDPLGPQTLGQVYAMKGAADEAYQAFSQALVVSPSFLPAVEALSAMDLAKGKSEEAVARFAAVAKANPKNVAAYLAQARIVAKSGGADERVLGFLKQARDADPSSPLALVEQASYLMSTSRTDKAIALLEPLLTVHAADPGFVDALARAYETSGAHTRAIQLLEGALQKNTLSGALNFRIGMDRMAIQDYAGALQSFKRTEDLQPNAVEPKGGIANALYAAGKKSEARAVVAAMIQNFPKNPMGPALLGDFALAEANAAEALKQYRNAFDLSQNAGTASKLLTGYFLANQPDKAMTFLRQWWNKQKDFGLMLQASGFLLERKEWSEAVAVLNEILKLDPNNAAALNNAAVAVHQMKEVKAIQLIERAYQLQPYNVSIMDTYGWISTEQGKTEQGLTLLKQAAQLAPGNSEIRLHLAQAYARQGDKKLAREEAAKVLSAKPGGDVQVQAEALMR